MPLAATPADVSIAVPNGLEGILATFGDIFAHIRQDGSLDRHWETEQLATISLAFPIPLSWDRSRLVKRLTCHRRLRGVVSRCFEQILDAGLQQEITSFGGCYSFRAKRSGTRLSAHSWGIAIDLNPEANAQGTAGHMNPGIVSIFSGAGFFWGGHWAGAACDPMHFQFCTGY